VTLKSTRSDTGRVALVTGAAGEIGSATCRCLAAHGYRVVVTYRSSAEEAKALLGSLPGDGHRLGRADVADSSSLTQLAAETRQAYGKLDLLVNNAGFTRYVAHDDLEGLTDEFIDEIFRTNWRGAFAAVRAFVPLLRLSDAGVIVNLSSIAGTTGEGSNVAYCASKAALDAMTKSLGRALAPTIRVVSVAPGLVQGAYAGRLDTAWSEAQRANTPLDRLVTPEEVAETIYAAAAHLTFSTGCIIPADGGRPLGRF
jgi:3-oxoacyl-[acyl-carrier protein] reductase